MSEPERKADAEVSPAGSPDIAGEIGDTLEEPGGHPAIDPERLPDEADQGTIAADAARDLAPMGNLEARKVVMAALKALDKVTAAAFRLPDTPTAELEEYAAAITPAVASYGHKPGPRFWLGVGFLAFLGFVASRFVAAVRVRQDGTPPPATAEREPSAAGEDSSGIGREVVEPK